MTSDLEIVLTIAGLAAITLLTRSLFLLSEREWPLPAWLQQGLRYAPLAALVAVVAPEIVIAPDGTLIDSWRDARLPAAAVASAYYWARRGILGTIVSGTATMLVLRLGFGW